jgi:hypothetical protein
MASPTCVSCQEVLSCNDSPLSVTGNIIGILTFAGAILISIQVYVNAMRNAERNMFEMTDTFRSRLGEADRFVRKLQEQSDSGNREQNYLIHQAQDQVRFELQRAEDLLHQLDPSRYDGRNRMWARARFVLREDMLKEGLEKTEKAVTSLKEVANEVLSQ